MPDQNVPVVREIDFAAEAKRAWGKDWAKPDEGYRFSNGRTFRNTDAQEGGPYGGDESA